MSIILLSAVIWQADTTDTQGERYLVMTNHMIYYSTDVLPYEELAPMCWDSTMGWCDEGMQELGHRMYYIIDWQLKLHGVAMRNDSLCWVWWFTPDYGIDNNPHIVKHNLISCEGIDNG